MVIRKKRRPSYALLLGLLSAVGCSYEPPTGNTSGANGGSGGAGGDAGGTSVGGSAGAAVGGSGGGGQGHELDCQDGLDNDFDGQADCGDSDCEPGYECVPIAPSGSGPYVRISLTTGEAMPATCSVDGSAPTIRGITPVDPQCTACGCEVVNVNCRMEVVSEFASGDCSGSSLVQQATSECMTLAQPLFTGASMMITQGQITGQAIPTPAVPQPLQPWKDVVQVCPAYKANPGGGCATGQFCVPKVTVPYESAMCVHAMNDVACTGEYGRKITAYDSALDLRSCAGCGCNPEILCNGYLIQLDGGGTCNVGMGPYVGFNQCTAIKAETRSVKLGTLTWQVGNKNIYGGQPGGSVTPTSQRTFCCTNP